MTEHEGIRTISVELMIKIRLVFLESDFEMTVKLRIFHLGVIGFFDKAKSILTKILRLGKEHLREHWLRKGTLVVQMMFGIIGKAEDK